MVPFKIASTMRDSRLNTAPVWLCWSLSATALRVSCFCVDTKNVFEHIVKNINQTHVFTGSIKSWIGRNWYMIDSHVVCMLKKLLLWRMAFQWNHSMQCNELQIRKGLMLTNKKWWWAVFGGFLHLNLRFSGHSCFYRTDPIGGSGGKLLTVKVVPTKESRLPTPIKCWCQLNENIQKFHQNWSQVLSWSHVPLPDRNTRLFAYVPFLQIVIVQS